MMYLGIRDDTEHDDGIPQVLHDIEGGSLSARQLKKLEIIRKDGKTPFYRSQCHAIRLSDKANVISLNIY
jgi:hypothetical protein